MSSTKISRWFVIFTLLAGGAWPLFSEARSESKSTFGAGHDPGRNGQKPQSVAAAKMRRLMSLVEYIGGDYSGAVSGGKIIDEFEYQEISEFSGAVLEIFEQIATIRPETNNLPQIRSELAALKSAVAGKKPADEVKSRAKIARELLIDSFELTLAPAQLPSSQLASQTFASHCASCHGDAGRGDGVLSAQLEPKPRDFTDPGFALGNSPFKTFNVLHAGVDGTAMSGFADRLNTHELWSLAFWISGLAHNQGAATAKFSGPVRKVLQENISLEQLSRLSDEELSAFVSSLMSPEMIAETKLAEIIAALRVHAPYQMKVPRKHEQSAIAGAIEKTRLNVAGAVTKAKSGNYSEAKALLLDAYLAGFEPVERSLRLKDTQLVREVEAGFIDARTALNNEKDKTLVEFMRIAGVLDQRLVDAGKLATNRSNISDEVENKDTNFGDFISSFLIIFREGFEAFLIIAALLAAVANMGMPSVKRWIHVGWVAAVGCGALTYFVLNRVVQSSGLGRELIEAIATGLAAAVLFYVGFWILSQAERTKWDQFIRTGAKDAVASGRVWALVGLAFMAVYREAAETILFYNALSNSASSSGPVVAGFFAGVLVLGGICFLIQKFGLRMPMRKFFLTTSILMVTLAVTLAGKAVAELIEAGIIAPAKISGAPTIDLLGLYPYWQTLGAQAALLALALMVSARKRMARIKNAALSLSVGNPSGN